MGCMLRSDKMTLFDIYIQPETAFEIITHFGNNAFAQFLDVNPETQAFQRNYVTEICRCSKMERLLRYMDEEIIKEHILKVGLRNEPKPLQPKEMLALENVLEHWESEVHALSESYGDLMKVYLEMSEMHYVLEKVGPMLGDSEIRNATWPENFTKDGNVDLSSLKKCRLMVITGVVKRVRSYAFQRMLWRLFHTNIYYRQAEEDKVFKDASGQSELKVAFLVICQGKEMYARLLKVCSGFRVNLYPCPRTNDERLAMTAEIGNKLSDQETVLKQTKYRRCKALYTVSRKWIVWKTSVKKAKAIYHTLNLFNLDVTKKCLIGRCWIPDTDVPKVQESLRHCSEKLGTTVESFMMKCENQSHPPTFHRTNKFTNGFQALINAYGESTYRELNPGLYTIITFPFLFAVMFGDIGHGIILVIFSSLMIFKEKKIISYRSTNEIFNIAFGGRYVIIMLGLFSIFTGFIYNDIFSVAMRFGGDSFWLCNKTRKEIEGHHDIALDPDFTGRDSYLFGMDPIWRVASNKIVVENSFKMKMSIILGVIHMTFGLLLGIWNDLHFKRYYHIFLVDIPQLLILGGLFIWLLILIYAKWFMFYSKSGNVDRKPGCAPLILILLIELVLAGQTTMNKPPECSSPYMFGKTQKFVHRALLLIVMLSIPVMLFGVPVYLLRKNKMKKKMKKNMTKTTDKEEEEEEFNMAEVMIKQAIHTIEYTLSTISHTASYLRLWALSLAHAQLSEMLWAMIFRDIGIRSCLTRGPFLGVIFLFVIFAIWASFTVTILVVMEGMSAFLHTLRLHWVEFMSKFYSGGGWMFEPFSFSTVLADTEDKPEGFCKDVKYDHQ